MNSVTRISLLSLLISGVLMFAAMGPLLAQEKPASEQAPKAAKKKDASKTEYPEQIKAKLEERGLRIGEPVDELLQHNINGWNRLDNQHLILTVGVSKKYLVRLIRYCRGLEHNENVQFSTVGSHLTDQDQIRVRGSLGVDRCQITDIHKLEKAEEPT